METYLIYFDGHRCLSQSEESKCMWTQGEDGIMWVLEKCKQGGNGSLQDRKGGGWAEGNIK